MAEWVLSCQRKNGLVCLSLSFSRVRGHLLTLNCAKVKMILFYFEIRNGTRWRFKCYRQSCTICTVLKRFNSLLCQSYLSYERQNPFWAWRCAIKYIICIYSIKKLPWFILGWGRFADCLQVRWILPLLCQSESITKHLIAQG